MLGLLALMGGLALLPAVAEAQGDAEVQRALDSWYKRAKRRAPGEWGIAIADQTGRVIWSVAEDRPLLPASTVKLFTTGFARSTLGGDARVATRVVGTGTVDPFTGQWLGTWALELNGDLSLERATRQGPQLADLAQQLAARGITHLQGPLVVRSADGPADATYPLRLGIAPPRPSLCPADRRHHAAREHRRVHGPPRFEVGCAATHHR